MPWRQVLDVHGGTTEDDLEAAFGRAEKRITDGGGAGHAFLFLDEMNACRHTGLVEEAITRHTLQGRPLHRGLTVVAAANPYRRRKATAANSGGGGGGRAGFTYQGAGASAGPAFDDGLVYNVHPIPQVGQPV